MCIVVHWPSCWLLNRNCAHRAAYLRDHTSQIGYIVQNAVCVYVLGSIAGAWSPASRTESHTFCLTWRALSHGGLALMYELSWFTRKILIIILLKQSTITLYDPLLLSACG